MLRVAILGLGWAGSRQVEAIRELGRKVSVECLVDNDADFLRQKATEFGIGKTYTDLDAALKDPDVDAVSICLLHALHCGAATEAARAGKHVLCEKPMAMTVEEATCMIDTAEAEGVTLFVAENVPYSPMSRFLRQIVHSGQYIGEVVSASVTRGFWAEPAYGYSGRRAWLSTPELGGTGILMLHGIHTMGQLRFVLGEVETVYMREHHASSISRSDLEGTMSGLLSMEGGFQVWVLQTCEAKLTGELGGFVIHGDRGSIRASQSGCEVVSDEFEEGRVSLQYPVSDLSDDAMEMEAFADQVSGVSEGPTTGESERRSLAIVQAGYESVENGQPVNFRERYGNIW